MKMKSYNEIKIFDSVFTSMSFPTQQVVCQLLRDGPLKRGVCVCICIFYRVGPILVLHPGGESVNLVACMESCFKALDCLPMHDAIWQMVPLDYAIYKERMSELSRPRFFNYKASRVICYIYGH